MSVKSKELIHLKLKFKSFLSKLNNLLHTSSISHLELQFYEMKSENYNFIFDQVNSVGIAKYEPLSNWKNANEINDIIIQKKEILKIRKLSSNSHVYQSNNLFKITIRFNEIDFNNNFNTTLKAILNIAQSLIIGSCEYGEEKSIIIHLLALDYEKVHQMYQDLIQIITNSNQITGNLSIINYKDVKKDSLYYSLGLTNLDKSNFKSISRLIDYIPQILEIS